MGEEWPEIFSNAEQDGVKGFLAERYQGAKSAMLRSLDLESFNTSYYYENEVLQNLYKLANKQRRVKTWHQVPAYKIAE